MWPGALNWCEVLGKIMQTITGVNGNIMGQYNKVVEVHKKLERFWVAQPGVWSYMDI